MIPFQQNSDCAYLAAEVWKGNTFKTAFKSKWCGQPKVSKRNNSLTFFEPQQSLQNEHSSNSLQIEVDQDRLKCTKRTLFHISIYESKALRNEHFPNSIQSELCGLIVQTGHFSKSIYGAAKGMKMNCFPTALKWLEVYKWNTFPTFFNGNKAYELNILPTAFKLKWSGQPKVYKGENFSTNLYTTAKPRKWTFSYSLHIEMSEIPWS